MSDRKYRQRGYQDEPREPRREQTPAQKKEYAAWAAARSAENLQHAGLPRGGAGARCGNELMAATAWSPDGTRGAGWTCTPVPSAHFDTSATYECLRPIRVRVSPKDAKNTCAEFEPKTTVERETKSAAPTSARKAFDDLFK